MKTPIPLEAILEIVDWQVEHHDGEDKKILIEASNLLFNYLHKDDPPEEYGN